jgi:DNA-binding PadR family transcriptional regulator/DNA-binding HxlR family transcriptional regulator
MRTENYPALLQGAEEKTGLTDTVKNWQETCNNCRPLTPATCVTDCKIWKQKNEFRALCKKMESPNFMTKLLNTLKNKRRIQILEVISKGRYSITRLQQELKKLGYYHSRQTIVKEYVTPLIEVGLVEGDRNQYRTTLFGSRLEELAKISCNIEAILPPHSECYEEAALGKLLNEPKTYKDFEGMIPMKSVARVLNRLQKAELIEKPKENDYVFYFKTKRDFNNAKLSPTERRVYENLPSDGISAQKLAEKTRISSRRTYKYLRKLKGKKLVFARKRQKSYALTAKGLQMALTLTGIHDLAVEASETASKIIEYEGTCGFPTQDKFQISKKKEKKIIPLKTTSIKQS